MLELVRARWRFQRALRRWRTGQVAIALDDGDRAVTMFAACAARPPGRGPDELACALLAMAGCRAELADHAAAELLCQRALVALDTRDNRALRVEALIRLGSVRRSRGDFDRAEETLRTALALAGDQPHDPALLGSAHNALGVLFKDTRRYPAAAREYEVAWRLLGTATDFAPAVCHNLAGLAYAEGRFVEAEAWIRRGLALREGTGRADSTGVAGDIVVLGAVLVALERYPEAEELLHRALDSWTARFGPEHYEISVCLHNLAVLHQRRGEPDAALRSFQDALRIREAVLGAGHPEVAVILNNLAALHESQGRTDDAAACRQRCLLLRGPA